MVTLSPSLRFCVIENQFAVTAEALVEILAGLLKRRSKYLIDVDELYCKQNKIKTISDK